MPDFTKLPLSVQQEDNKVEAANHSTRVAEGSSHFHRTSSDITLGTCTAQNETSSDVTLSLDHQIFSDTTMGAYDLASSDITLGTRRTDWHMRGLQNWQLGVLSSHQSMDTMDSILQRNSSHYSVDIHNILASVDLGAMQGDRERIRLIYSIGDCRQKSLERKRT
jgi:hypothetical protein